MQVTIFLLFLLALLWSGFFLWSPLMTFWGTMFTECERGFSYDAVAKRCNCEYPFNGTFCEVDMCVNGNAVFGALGWSCDCADHWTGSLCDVCGTHDKDKCKAPVPYPNGNKCRSEVVADGVEVEFLGSDCDLICIKAENVRSLKGTALETYEFYLAKSPFNTLACPSALCYGCDPSTREALCVDGALKSFSSKECDVSCGPFTNEFSKPCNRRGICSLQGDTPVCQCNALSRGKECGTLCPGVTELFNGLSSTLVGPECSSQGSCNDDGVCECLTDASGDPLFLGDDCGKACPTDSSGTVCSGHGSCVISGTDAVCQCDQGWFNPTCGCSDGTTATKTCLHGECLTEVNGCDCHDDDILGHWSGEFCSVCKENWFSESTFCLQYCNVEETCNGNAAFCQLGETVTNEEGLVVPCTATTLEDGTISLSGTCATCACDATFTNELIPPSDDQSLFQQCHQCVDTYYPKVGTSPEPPELPFCSVSCDADKCHQRGACLKNSGECVCFGDCSASLDNIDGECLMLDKGIQPSFVASENCGICETHWGPDIKGTNFWDDSCRYYCNPDATESDALPTSCYTADGFVKEECVFCSGRADNCSNANSGLLPTCNCQDGYAGTYCESTCGSNGAASCGDGQCIENQLHNWFDLTTPTYQRNKDPTNGYSGSWRCACNPQDIGVEDRNAYEEAFYAVSKYGLTLDSVTETLPPRSEYFGLQCTAECPQVAGKACDGRGYCKSYEIGLSPERCSTDTDCSQLSNNVEDPDRFCYFEQKPLFWDYVSKLPPATLSACSAEEIEWMTSFVDTHDWNRFCYNYMKQAVPPETHTVTCRDCSPLVESTELWQSIDEKCASLVEFSNFETLQSFTEDCSGECTQAVATFDWQSWCEFPKNEFTSVCPSACSDTFQKVDWVSDNGFCATLDGFLENHELVGKACDVFRRMDTDRGRDHDNCVRILEGGNDEYKSSTSCFVPRETVQNEFGAVFVQPFSGTNNQIQCFGLAQNRPEVCGSVEHVILFNASSTTQSEDAFEYCMAKFPHGWSDFSQHRYVVETRIGNHTSRDYTDASEVAVHASYVEDVAGGKLRNAGAVFYRASDNIMHEGVLVGECRLAAPKCFSCGAGDSLRNGTGAVIRPEDNPTPEKCCSRLMYFQSALDPTEHRYWCHEESSVGEENCQYSRCSDAIKAYDWKSELKALDNLNGLDGAPIEALESASVRRSFSLDNFCKGRRALDDRVRLEASGVNAFQEYCEFVRDNSIVYGIQSPVIVAFFDEQEDSPPDLVKLNIVKESWWQSVGTGDILSSYNERFWYYEDPVAKRIERQPVETIFDASKPMLLSFWLHLPATDFENTLQFRLEDTRGSLRYLSEVVGGAILQLDIRSNKVFLNYRQIDYAFDNEVSSWEHIVVYFDWNNRQFDIEVAETFESREHSMLCVTETTECRVFEREESYDNYRNGLYAEKVLETAGAYDLPYQELNTTDSVQACQKAAEAVGSLYFLHSSTSGICHAYDATNLDGGNFTDTSASDNTLFVYKMNGVLSTSIELNRAVMNSPETEVFVHDFRVVPQGSSLVGSYMHRALQGNGRSETTSADDCYTFLARPSGTDSLDDRFTAEALIPLRWGRICEDFFSTMQLSESTIESFCFGTKECEAEVNNFVENDASLWYYRFANQARPNQTKTNACASKACEQELETFDYEEACSQSLRDIYETCEGSCSSTFKDWRAGKTDPPFNKSSFCESLASANKDIQDTFASAVTGCSEECKALSEEVNYLDFCSQRLVTHDKHAPYVMSHNLSSYCKRQVFSTLVDELKGTEHALNYTRDCKNLGERGSTKIIDDKPGVCHRVECECTTFGMSGDRCNIECTVGTSDPASPCNEAVGLGICCLEPPEGETLSFLNCRTDYNPPTSSYTVGECLCMNRGTSDLISGVNCDTQCAKCSESFGECSKTSGTCICQNSEYMETILSHESVQKNATFDALGETSEDASALLFDWANAETEDAQLEGDIRTQVPVVLLYDSSLGDCSEGVDQCCDWTDSTPSTVNPLDPEYAFNELAVDAGPADILCTPDQSYEACIDACLRDTTCSSVEVQNETTKINNKRANWPLKGQLMLSEFALVQEPLNYLPQTVTTGGLTGGKCRSYTLQSGRYRVLYQSGVYKKGLTCGVGSGTSSAIGTFTTVREAYLACQNDRNCNGFTKEGNTFTTFQGYTTSSNCQAMVETQARPELVPRPVSTGRRVLYRNNWCTVKESFDGQGNLLQVQNRAFGLIASVECEKVTEQHSYPFELCQFPFYLPVWDTFRNEFVVEKITECTDLNVVDGYLGKTAERDASGLAQSNVLLDFQSLKAEITALTGIQEPKYCVSAKYLQNISEHLEREAQQKPFSTCRKNAFKRSKCTRDAADSGEGNCKCGQSVCEVNEYCYEKLVNNVNVFECHRCDDLLSPAPEQCCKVGESLHFLDTVEQGRCVAPSDPDYASYCNASWGCPRNWGSSTAVGDMYQYKNTLYEKGTGPRPELFCDNSCWNYALQICSCDCEMFPSPLEVLRQTQGGSKVGGLHGAQYVNGAVSFTSAKDAPIPIPFLRICKDPMVGAINNSQYSFNVEEEKHYRDAEFIRNSRATENNPSSRCGVDCEEVCPGVDPVTNVPCNNRGQCNTDCQCSCFSLDTISDRTFFLTELRGGGLGALPDYSISSTNSPYRGSACEGVCPGFDQRYELLELSDNDKLFIMKELVCSGHGLCLQNQQGSTQCSCEAGHKSGSLGSCEFHCPGAAGLCNGHGECAVEPVGSSRAFVEGLVRIWTDLLEEEAIARLTVELDANNMRKITVVLQQDKLVHKGAKVRIHGLDALSSAYEVAKVKTSKEFVFYTSDAVDEGDYFDLQLEESEFATYDPDVLEQTVSHRMTSFVFETNALESAYSVTNNRYYISPDARKAVDDLMPQVKYLSKCPEAFPYVYHHGLYCCQFPNSANGTFLNQRSELRDCPRRQRMECPTIEWFEQERGLLERFGAQSRFINKDGKTSLSFFCRKTVLTTEEESLCAIERQLLEDNTFSTNRFHYTCDQSIDMARMVQDSRPYYDSWAILELGAGRADGLLYTYKDTHCKNIIATEENSNGLTLEDQPQPITLLECALCQCQNSADSGFWQGVECDDCSYGFSGQACKGTCAGVCPQISVGAELMWYEEYQNTLSISKPCDNPRRDGFFYSCPVKADLKEITVASGRVWDDGDVAEGGTDTGYERSIFCQDGRDSSGSCIRCKTPMVGTIDLAFEEAPERSCNRLTCPRMDSKLKRINRLQGEFSIDLSLSMWQSNFPFDLYGSDVAYELNQARGLSRSLPIDLFLPCPSTHKDVGENMCCPDGCETLRRTLLTLNKQFSLYHNEQTLSEQDCAALALSTDLYPIVANGQIIGQSTSTYFKASKGFFSHSDGKCRVYKGFESYTMDYFYLAQNDAALLNGILAFTDQVETSETTRNFRAYYTCDENTCAEEKISKELRKWSGTSTDQEHSTAVTTTYELACVYNNDYASILVEGSDEKEDGLLERTLDPYLSSDDATSSIVDLVALLQKDKCTMRFFQLCRQGHALEFQNPFLTFYAFMKLDEYLEEEYPDGANQANRCDWSIYKGRLWCPQCPRCQYTGEIPGYDLKLDTSVACEVGYFPYCKAATETCSADHWRTDPNCALASFAPSFRLVDSVRQTVDFENSTKVSLGTASQSVCALKAMAVTKQGYFFYGGCESDECECFYYSSIQDSSALQLVTSGYLYEIDYTSTFGEINVFERYIAQFMKDSADTSTDLKGWMVEQMRQAVPDKYRSFSVEISNGTFMEEHRQWLECACVVSTGNEQGRDWCEHFDVTRCVYFNPVQLEWELLWYDQGILSDNVPPSKELGALHDPNGAGAVLRSGGRLKSDVERIVVSVPDTCTETLPDTLSADYDNTQFLASQIECGHSEEIHCIPPEGNRSTGYFDFRPVQLRDTFGNTVAHYRCKEKVASRMTIGQCANEAHKRFSVYNGTTWLSRGYFAVERPQLDASLFSAHTDYEIYSFDESNELDCFVYRNVDLTTVRSDAWNGLSESFCTGIERKNDRGCPRASTLYTSKEDGCTDCDASLPAFGGECESPEFVRSYYIPNLSDAGGFPSFTLVPLVSGPITCFKYGPCFTATEEWNSCRPTMLTGSVPSLHYPYYSETPLHDMSDAQKTALGISTEANYLENMEFDTSFGFWTQVRDNPSGVVYESYRKDWLNLCYEDMKLSDREKILLANRELYRSNDYTQYNLLYMDLVCPAFADLHREYHARTKGRFAASRWADGTRLNREEEFMHGSGHTKLMRIRVNGTQSNYIYRALVILDKRLLNTSRIVIGDPAYPSYATDGIPYDAFIKPYCDAGTQVLKPYGNCLDLTNAAVSGTIYWKQMDFNSVTNGKVDRFIVRNVPTVATTLSAAVQGDVYIEHDSVILLFENEKYYPIQSFQSTKEVTLPREAFQIYKDTGRAETSHAEDMFESLYVNSEAGLAMSGEACAPMSQDLSGLRSKLTSAEFGGTASAEGGLRFFRPQTLDVIKLLSSDHTNGFGPSCGCQAGFANVRYSDYNQPWELQSGCSAPEGDSTGTMIDYKPCFGVGSCLQYASTPHCAGFDIISTSFNKVCVNEEGLPEVEQCNRPFGGCIFGQRGALNIDSQDVECKSSSNLKQNHNNMAASWLSPHAQNFVIDVSSPRTQYDGTDDTLGVVYVENKPKDKAKSNYNFLTSGCHACTNGRYQDETNSVECKQCAGGFYNSDANNPWRIPPNMDAMGNLPSNRWKDQEKPAFEYEWWNVAGFPATGDEWHEVNEWQVLAPLPPYYKDETGHWQYDSMRSQKPVVNLHWALPKHVHKGCAACMDNFASIPLALECTVEGVSAAECPNGQLLHEVGDTREGYNYPSLGNRAVGANRNCLACPAGYDTGIADHINGGESPADKNGLQECPIDFPYAFSTKEHSPYYGSHCCKEGTDAIGDQFSYGYFYDTAEQACPSGHCKLARKDTVCMVASYGVPVGPTLLTRRSPAENNLEYCNRVAMRSCVDGHSYHLNDELDQCRCHRSINATELPVSQEGTLSCFPRRLWSFAGDCKYTKFIGKRYHFDIKNVARDKSYTLHLTSSSRAAAQYSMDAEDVWDVNPNDIIESMPLTYRTRLHITLHEQCEAMASAELMVQRFSVNTETNECMLVYFAEDEVEQRLREETQVCQPEQGWESYDVLLSTEDIGNKDMYRFDKDSCLTYAYRTSEQEEHWLNVTVNVSVEEEVMTLFEKKHPYGAAVEKLPNAQVHYSFTAAAAECFESINCVGVGTESTNNVVQHYFAAKHDDAFDNVIKDQEEQSLFYYRKKLLLEKEYKTYGYYFECQRFAGVQGESYENKTLDCFYEPTKCYEQCRQHAENENATAFSFPSFSLGEGMPDGLPCQLYTGDVEFESIGEASRMPSEYEYLQRSSCIRMENHFQNGYVACDANYDNSGMEATNGFYCADFDYRMHEKGYNGGDHGLEGIRSQKKTCLVEEMSPNGICETESVLGTCTSYNVHGKCQTYNYKGMRTRRNPNTTVTEQDQHGTCVSESTEGDCSQAAKLGRCTETSALKMDNRYPNPLGLCRHKDGTETVASLGTCNNMHTFEAFSNEVQGNFNFEPLYMGPMQPAHSNTIDALHTYYFISEDLVFNCERSCERTERCLTFGIENRELSAKELAPFHTPSFRRCTLYASNTTLVLNKTLVQNSRSTVLDSEEELFFYRSRVYTGRANVNDGTTLDIFKTIPNTFGTECMHLCDEARACVAYAYNASNSCELLRVKPLPVSLYRHEVPFLPVVEEFHVGTYTSFLKAYEACERDYVPFNPYREHPTLENRSCVGIQNISNVFRLVHKFAYGGISVIETELSFSAPSCFLEFASVASKEDCEGLTDNVPYDVAFEGEEQRFAEVVYFSHDATEQVCHVIKPGYSLDTCPLGLNEGFVVYEKIASDLLRRETAGGAQVYTNRQDHGSLDVSPTEHALFQNGYHGVLGECSKSLGAVDTPMECIGMALDEPNVVVEKNNSIVRDTDGVCEKKNDRGTMVNANKLGHCHGGVSEYGDCIQEVNHGVCTRHSGKGTCIEYSNCVNSVLGQTGKGRCEFENRFGNCTYETRLGTCTKESLLGECQFTDISGRCEYFRFDGQCIFRTREFEVEVWLEDEAKTVSVPLLTESGTTVLHGVAFDELPLVAMANRFEPYNAWFRGKSAASKETLMELCAEDFFCKGVTPSEGTYGLAAGRDYEGTLFVHDAVEGLYVDALKINRRSIEMENDRDFHTEAVLVEGKPNTMSVLELSNEPLLDVDDICESECQKYAMKEFDGTNTTQEWYHQVQNNVCFCGTSANITCNNGSVMHNASIQVNTRNFRQLEAEGVLQETFLEFPTAIDNGLECSQCPMGYYEPTLDLSRGRHCQTCPNGRYNDESGMVGDCTKLCPVGTSYSVTRTLNDPSLHDTFLCPNCVAGTYQDQTGTSSCIDCVAGKYSTTIAATSSSMCIACGLGTFSTVVGANSSATCSSCPAGTYQDQTGSTECKDCSAGYYSGTIRASTVDACIGCEVGYYSTSVAATSSATCVGCPAGRYNAYVGAPSLTDCSLCSSGTYSTTFAATSSSTCIQCSAGRYNTEEGSDKISDCTECAAGRYSTTVGASENNCIACDAGRYSGTVGATSSSTCNACVAGRYSGTVGATSSSTCIACTAGKYSTSLAATTSSTCTDCPIGRYQSETGQIACVPCPVGTITGDNTGLTECKNCPTGSYQDQTNSRYCKACEMGQYQNLEAQDSCKDCPAGRYADTTGASSSYVQYSFFADYSCKNCAVGQYSLAGSASCLNCPTGKYQDEEGLSPCKDCAAGLYQDSTGQTSCNSCSAYSSYRKGTTTYRARLGFGYNDYTTTGNFAYISASSGASSCTLCSGCQIANSDFTQCIDGPDYWFQEFFGKEASGGIYGYETLKYSGSSTNPCSGNDADNCIKRCFDACKGGSYYGFIVRTDGRCWCEHHGGYKAAKACQYVSSSNYRMMSIVTCGANGASQPNSDWRPYGSTNLNPGGCRL